MTRIAVIGGGISGLSTVHALERLAKEAGLEISTVLLEKEERIGGKIWSRREEGYLCEWGPNGFLDSKPMTLELCDRLGIRERLLRSDDNARKRFIITGGQLHRLPENGPIVSQIETDLLAGEGCASPASCSFRPSATA